MNRRASQWLSFRSDLLRALQNMASITIAVTKAMLAQKKGCRSLVPFISTSPYQPSQLRVLIASMSFSSELSSFLKLKSKYRIIPVTKRLFKNMPPRLHLTSCQNIHMRLQIAHRQSTMESNEQPPWVRWACTPANTNKIVVIGRMRTKLHWAIYCTTTPQFQIRNVSYSSM